MSRKPDSAQKREGNNYEEIRGIIANPIYAGIGPCPAMITDEQWVKAAVKAIQEDGPERFLVNMLFVLRESLKQFEIMRGDAHEKT